MTQPVNDRLVSRNKTTDRSQRFTESTHNQVDFVCQTEMVANTASLFSEYTQSMSFVHHDSSIIFMFQTHYFGQIS